MSVKQVFIFIFLLFQSVGIWAQKVSGYVKDSSTKEPIMFCNVVFKNTLQGSLTDENGYYEFSEPGNDTLLVSSVGYYPAEVALKKAGNVNMTVLLKKKVTELNEVTIKPETPRAKVIFKKIQEHKKENKDKIARIADYKTIENTTVLLAVDTASNIKNFIGNLDEVTFDIDDQDLRFSPIYIAESANEVRNSKGENVYLNKQGIFPKLNNAIETFILNSVVVDMDFYNDQIYIMDRGFISPISNMAPLYYNLYLNDSTVVDDVKQYHYTYAPKNKFNPLFSGGFTVVDSTFALRNITAYISKDANLNFVNGFSGEVTYKEMPNGSLFFDEQNLNINLALSMNKDSISVYSSERADNVTKGNWLINKSTHYTTSDRLSQIAPKDWNKQPEFVSSGINDKAYASVDKLKEQKVVKGIDLVGGAAMSSYLNMGKIDVGPVFDIYSTNTIEGTRLTIPLRTSQALWERFYVGGFVGMGTKSKELKYGLNVGYQPTKEDDRIVLKASYSDDYNLISNSKFHRFIKNNPNNKGNGNFIAALTTWERNPYLKEEQNVNLGFEYNFPDKDTHLEATPYFSQNWNTPVVRFVNDGVDYQKYYNYGVLVNCRFSFGQHFDRYFLDRVYYINRIPVINLSWDVGKVSVPDSKESYGMYSHLHGAIYGRITQGAVFINYMLNAGYLWGDAPYELLDQPVGSMSYGYAKYRFNLLHHASFAHNLYTNLHAHLNGGGVLLNRLPLIKHLKLREIVSLKVHYGKLGSGYKSVFDLPDYYKNDMFAPYAEIGFGVTNIFKVLRVEYVHQLTNKYEGSGFTDVSGIRFRTEMSF
nr:DUF5686 family protein [uncultured Carboxylicivirga sp.]